ncbi:MAG: lactate dehydrogenase [Candidatus Cloacimonadota bacterium]|nr:MAG: lactate dehydrogenase [Candidatus Cloacimonadota bacterium]
MRYAKVEEVYLLIKNVFVKLGVPEDEAKICADVLILSDLHGIESHGVGRLKMYYDRIKAGIQFTETKIEVIRDKCASAVWDGNHGMGHVIGHKAMQKAMEKAEIYGIGTVAVRNSTHYGICGYYAKEATRKNMIGMTFTNARPSVAPLFGVAPMLGTNPVCFGAPTNLEYPFLYDAATSITQRGKIEVLDRANKPTPEGWAISADGSDVSDTKKLLVDLVDKKASLLALGGAEEVSGGHKGYGLSTMVEILSSALAGGSYLHGLHGWKDGKRVPYRLGHLFMAIDIEHFIDPEEFKKITSDILVQLQNSAKAKNRERIYVAGEKEYLNEQRIRKTGIPINDNLLKNINIMREDLELDFNYYEA